MTTTRVPTRTYFLAIGLLVIGFLPLITFAENTATGITPTTTTAISSEATNTVGEATPTPWFTVEKLVGDNQAVGDFVVGPGLAEFEVVPGQSVTFPISVANRISDNRTFELSVEDIEGSADAGQSVILLGEQRGPYTLKDYISFPSKTFKLNLGERARIPVTITIPKDAEPGGFYGSVLVSTLQADGQPVEGQMTRSPIIARIGTLFFVTVPGETLHAGELKEVALKNNKLWYEKGPINFNILFENTGSVHLNPYGELRVKNLFGEEVGFLELEPWFALPKSLRSREVVWDRELLFGRYTATVKVNRGYDDIVDEKSVVFWVLPWKIMAGIFGVIFVLFFIIRVFFRTFEFKRKT